MVSPMSATEVERASERDAKHYELVRGELKHKPIGMRSMFIAGQICARLNEVLYPDVGVAVVAAMVYCFGRQEHCRRPDVVYVRRERLPGTSIPTNDLYVAPDLVAEVLSPTMTALDWDDRVSDYRAAGVALVWIVNPERRTIRAYRADETTRLYRSGEFIQSESLLPGVRLEVAQLFPRE